MGFRCVMCRVPYDDDSQKGEGVVFMGILVHVCKKCKSTGNREPNTHLCAFCDEAGHELKEYVEGDAKALLCDRCLRETEEQRDDPRYI